MTFIWPHMLWLLLLLPILVMGYFHLLSRRRKMAARYASLSMVREAAETGPGIRRHVPPLLMLATLFVMILAIARPMATITLPAQTDTVIIAMDISGSMEAADMEPNRFTVSREAVSGFISDQPRNTRIGIVAFAGTVNMVQQPTLDREEILSTINRLQLQQGTNLGGGILYSLQAIFPDADLNTDEFDPADEDDFWLSDDLFNEEEKPPVEPVEPGSYTNAAIVLLTDGEPTTGPDPLETAALAAERGVRIFTVGFGSEEGELVNFGGMSMRVQLDEDLLRRISEMTRGRYFTAGSTSDLAEVYRSLTTQFGMQTEQTEVTSLFSALAALLMLFSATLSFIWFSRIA